MTAFINKFWPHLLAVVVMILLSSIFFSPYVFQGKVIEQFDVNQAKGIQTELIQYKKAEGEPILWTNALFGGMPAYQIWMPYSGKTPVSIINRATRLFQSITAPHGLIFSSMFFTYLLLVVLGVDWRLSIAGAAAMGFCNYNMDLYVAGHVNKIAVVSQIGGIFAGAVLLFRKKWLIGGAIFGLALAMQLITNHIQITYYTAMMVGIYIIVQMVSAAQGKGISWADVAKAVSIMGIAAVLALGTALPNIWTTYEYASDSQRGKSELASKKDGLSKAYSNAYSLGIKEAVLPTFVANYYGGGAEHSTVENTQLYKTYGSRRVQQMIQAGINAKEAEMQVKKFIAQGLYTGSPSPPGVSIYFGILVWFFAIMALVVVKGPEKWWLAASALLMLIISMGSNVFLNRILFDYFPMYNKFRATSMAMGLAQLTTLVLAFLGMKSLFSKTTPNELKMKALMIGGGVVGGVLLLMFMGANMGVFSLDVADSRITKIFGDAAMEIAYQDRKSLMMRDWGRSFVLLLIGAGVVWMYIKHKIKALPAALIVGAIILLDAWSMGKRIASNDKFVPQREVAAKQEARPVDQQIMQDPDPHYRVLDLSSGNPYVDAYASRFHKSVGGYFSAKLMVYEELKNKYLMNPIAHKNILGMLNTKYIIGKNQQNGQLFQSRLPEACGNAWFVEEYELMPNADEELNGLDGLDTKKKAIIQDKYKSYLEGFQIRPDSTASIQLTDYHPEKLTYNYSANTEQLAIFSEMYYPPSKGWEVYLNGEKIEPFIKANYALRALRLPPGQNQKLEMRFHPTSYHLGNKISWASSLVLVLLFLGATVLYFMKNQLQSPVSIDNEPLATQKNSETTIKKTQARTKSAKKGKNKR